MRHYYDSAEELVGNTPLLKLNNVGAPEGVDIFAKLELWNPAGSVKDRTGLYMVRVAEEKEAPILKTARLSALKGLA